MSDRDFWLGAARRLALRRNVASWSDAFVSSVPGLTVTAALVLLTLRLMGLPGPELRLFWFSLAGVLALAAVVCAAIAGRRPFTFAESLARLDEVGQLHNRLISAHAGIGEWPGRKPGIRDSVQWNWTRLSVPVLIGGLLLGAASLVELPKVTFSARPTEEPIAWTQIESWLKTLEQAKVLDQPSLDKLKEQVDDLRRQPEQDWYSQSSLEAGDALQEQTGQSLRELEENLEKSAELMTQALQAGEMPASQLQSLSTSLKDVAQGMLSGNLPLNKELAGKLRDFDPSSLKSMSLEQMRALQQRLNDGAKVCSECVGPHPAEGGTATKEEVPSGPPWGGGPAPLGLDDQAENLHTKRLEGASNEDPSRAVPGEVIAIAKGRHNVDKTTQAGVVEGGAISSAGEGGDAVWRDSLTPDERQVLQKYFK
jgi:hypothetical protein